MKKKKGKKEQGRMEGAAKKDGRKSPSVADVLREWLYWRKTQPPIALAFVIRWEARKL